MMRKCIFPLIYLVVMILLFVFGWLRWDFVRKANYMAGTITTLLLVVSYLVMTVFAVIYAIIGRTHKSWQSGLPLLMSILICAYSVWFVFTPLCSSIEHKVNLAARCEVIDLVNSGEIINYQVDTELFVSPLRKSSYDGTIRVVTQNDVRYVFFNSFTGFKKNLLVVYSENGIDGIEDFIYGHVVNTRELGEHWYSVIVSY